MRHALLIVALCGCASANPSPETPRAPAIYQSASTGVLVGEKPRAAVVTVPVPPQTAWMAVKKVYADLGVPVTVDNPSAHQIGNDNFNRSRSFAGHPMTEFVDCGAGMTGQKAASYRIYISLLTEVNPDGKGGTMVQTTFVPIGQDVAGGDADRIPCGTTGVLEKLVLDRVQAAIGIPPGN